MQRLKAMTSTSKRWYRQLELGFNYTGISNAYVEAPAFYDEPRAEGGKIASGLEPRSALPLFADSSYSLYAQFSGINLFGGAGALRFSTIMSASP